ncbi:MAG: queuosine precursor transporter [Anaerolineales bacterium]|nr:queuosine precursor transporter [Anaerolineales bacterium]
MKQHRFFPLVTAVFVTALIVSNIVAVKQIELGPFKLTAALLIFSVSYIFGDVLTEVYGYAKARQVIWIGFGCNLLAVVSFLAAGALPPSSTWALPGFESSAASQTAYDAILGYTPLILLASFAAYLAGEFLNSFVMAKMKIWSGGRRLWMRTIGSTFVAQIADTGIFVGILAFGGLVAPGDVLPIMLGEWLSKVAYEVLATPVTYRVVNWLKRKENEDYFDRETDFTPFKF